VSEETKDETKPADELKHQLSQGQILYARKVMALLSVQRAEAYLRGAIMLPAIPGQRKTATEDLAMALACISDAEKYLQGKYDAQLDKAAVEEALAAKAANAEFAVAE